MPWQTQYSEFAGHLEQRNSRLKHAGHLVVFTVKPHRRAHTASTVVWFTITTSIKWMLQGLFSLHCSSDLQFTVGVYMDAMYIYKHVHTYSSLY